MKPVKYPHLFSPITIRGKRLRNRIISSAQCPPNGTVVTGDYEQATENMARYMGQLARGGAAVVNTGHLGVDPRFKLGSLQYSFDFFNDRMHIAQLPMMHLMTDTVHAYGALAAIELNHGGSICTPFEGNTVLGPMDKELENGLHVAAMDEAEMEKVAEMFGKAAGLAKKGGFDIINVHGAHNWLIGQFLSPISNQRTDAYGGSPENRARFPKMILKSIREHIGEDTILSFRYSANELVPGGAPMEEVIASIQELREYADIIHCSAGKVDNVLASIFLFPCNYTRHGVNAYLAKEVKEHLPDCIVEAVGSLNDPALADQLIAEGACDLVAIARGFIADNDWARKVHMGKEEDIRPCIRCCRCLAESFNFKGHRTCTVNPTRVLTAQLAPDVIPFEKKKVVVVGGGPAGLQAANELAIKGHDVVLMEKGGKLGGRLEYADHIEFKADIACYRDYLIRQVMKKPNITVLLNTEATPENISAQEPDALVVAIGAVNKLPPVPGADLPHVIHGADLFTQADKVGQKVVVIGGGAVGCEATIWLHGMDKDVDLVEMGPELMAAEEEDYPDQRFFTLHYVNHVLNMDAHDAVELPEKENVHIRTNTRCLAVTPEGVKLADQEGKEIFLPADTVVMATGLQVDQAANDRFEGLAPDVIYIGDCRKPGDLYGTSTTGYYAAVQL